MIIRSLVILLLLTAYNGSFCQVKDYPFSKLDIKDGLSDGHVSIIFKDRHGYVWFGTRSGLNRYDGYEFRVFRHDDADSSSLTDDNVAAIYEGPEGKLYISTRTGGINIYDPLTERFIPQTGAYLQSRHLSRFGLIRILPGKDRDFYFVYSDGGIYRCTSGSAAVRINAGNAATTSPINDADIDSSGNLWLSHNNSVLEKIDLQHSRLLQRVDVFQGYKPKIP